LLGHDLPAGLGEVTGQRLAVPAGHVTVGVDAHPLVVGDADELKRPIFEKRALNTAAPGVDAYTQEDDVSRHQVQPFRLTVDLQLRLIRISWAGWQGAP